MAYQLIQSIAGVKAICIVRQDTETHCSVGFRSLDTVDVSSIASSFGGGGHKQAAGLYIEGIDALCQEFLLISSKYSTLIYIKLQPKLKAFAQRDPYYEPTLRKALVFKVLACFADKTLNTRKKIPPFGGIFVL